MALFSDVSGLNNVIFCMRNRVRLGMKSLIVTWDYQGRSVVPSHPWEDMFQDPQWMPETADNAKPYK